MITIIKQPTPINVGQPLQMVDSATIYYELSSNNATQSGFKYLNNITITGPITSGVSYLYKVPPRPGAGLGLFAASDILKSYTSYTANPYITNFLFTPECYVEWNTVFYEEWDLGKTFSDTFFSAGALGLTFATAHGLLTGDVITIDKDNKQINPQYDGTCSVVNVPNAVSLITSKSFGASSTAEGGTITNVIKYSSPATASSAWGFNGTRQYNEVNLSFVPYTMGYGGFPDYRLLTKYTAKKKVFMTDWGTMGFQVATASTNLYLQVDGFDVGNNLIVTGQIGSTWSSGRSFDIPVYPENLMAASINLFGVKDYNIAVWDSVLGQVSGTYSFEIVQNCSPYENFRIMFLNSLGKMDYWNFNWLSKDTYNVERTEFKKTLPAFHSIGDRGQTILSQNVQRSFYLSSDWITEYDSQFLKELVYSPEIYWVYGGNYYPLIITDTQYEVRTYLKDKLFCMFINVKFAYREATQNQ